MTNEPIKITDLKAKRGDLVLPKWERLVRYVGSTDIIPGGFFKITRLPNGTIVTPAKRSIPWLHPFMVAINASEEFEMYVGRGTVNNIVPWVSEDVQVGNTDSNTGQFVGVKVEPQQEGSSWIAVGVNIQGTDSEFASLELADLVAEGASGFSQLRIKEIKELPAGRGSGGVQTDERGYAWYALAQMDWLDNELEDVYQIVYHNLQHSVASSKVAGVKVKERHFFYPN